jgi:ribonucleoside-diphosphate reductase beta chain
VHGYYLGYKYQLAVKEATPERQAELKNFALSLMKELYENEEKYTEHIYDDLNITEHVKTFLRYNCNKSLNNLGYESVFTAEETDVLPQILSSLSRISFLQLQITLWGLLQKRKPRRKIGTFKLVIAE